MKEKIRDLVKSVLLQYINSNKNIIEPSSISIEVPKNEKFGDYSTNIAIELATILKKPPKEIAKELADLLVIKFKDQYFNKVEAMPQGFINFYLNDSILLEKMMEALNRNKLYGHSKIGAKKKILLEYVSANPTGPLHVGHGRWAVIGNVLANILDAVGFKVDSEFYVNDIGNQIDLLIRSVEARIKNQPVPEGGYGGDYIKEFAEYFSGGKVKANDVMKLILDRQKQTLLNLRVSFDSWFMESSLHKDKKVMAAVSQLEGKKLIYTENGAKWFRSTQFGDEKDRVLEKEEGTTTYFASDIAYHLDKFKRKYDRLINVWGTDHHGYVARLKAALEALGYPKEKLEVIIGQLVILYRGSEQIRMSKRTGEMITLQEVMDEIGVDATRYFLVMTSPNTHINFDLDLAKKKSLENPVYYVQYAHARICSILFEAKQRGYKLDRKADLKLLKDPSERCLLIKILRYPDEITGAALFRQPHKLTNYAENIAATFHNFYHNCRVISDDKDLSYARLLLIDATRIVIRNVLELLGVVAPENM